MRTDINRIRQRGSSTANRSRIEAKTQGESAETHADNAEIRTELAETRADHAEIRIEQAETRTELAETRADHAEIRTEQAKTRTELAETRADNAEIRTEQAKTRTELAETRADNAEIRTEQAKTRTELAEVRADNAEIRTEQAETALKLVIHLTADLPPAISTQLVTDVPVDGIDKQKSLIDQLTSRQREILRLIAEGQNTKQIAGILKISPKTVEYHRMKLMDCLNVHDVPGLVRFALRVGLVPTEN